MLALLLALAPADAAQIAYTRPQLCGLSTVVVVAEVTSTETRWSVGEDGGIETLVWLAPREGLKGVVPEPLALVVRGGQLGELGLVVEDQPALALDHTYLLLLQDTPAGLMVVGGEHGAVQIAVDGHDGEPLADAKKSLGDCRAP